MKLNSGYSFWEIIFAQYQWCRKRSKQRWLRASIGEYPDDLWVKFDDTLLEGQIRWVDIINSPQYKTEDWRIAGETK